MLGILGFGLGIIGVLTAVIAVVVALVSKDEDIKAGGTITAVVATILAVIFIGWSTFREVPTNSVGVPTAVGRVETAMRPGAHFFVAPWTRVNILDENVQTTTFEGDNCLDVRIGGQQTACLDATIQWRINDNGAGQLFKNYNNGGGVMQNITDSVVVREFKQVVNQVLGDYNPIQDVALNSGSGNSQFTTFGPRVESQMKSDLSGQIVVMHVYMPLLRYDAATQNRLNQIQAQYADTAIANELKLTNLAQQAANKAVGNPTPVQVEYLCLQIVQNAEKTGFTGLPETFNCSGSNGSVFAVTGK